MFNHVYDNQTMNDKKKMIFIHKTMTFAIRELNSQKEKKSCHNKTKFSLNYEIHSYLSACLYLNK